MSQEQIWKITIFTQERLKQTKSIQENALSSKKNSKIFRHLAKTNTKLFTKFPHQKLKLQQNTPYDKKITYV